MDNDDDCLIISEIKTPLKKKIKSPFLQKTKQARLPFAPLISKQVQTSKAAKRCSTDSVLPARGTDKKRRLSQPSAKQSVAAKKPAPASVKRNRCRQAADDEVSSSCDENQLSAHNAEKSPSKSPVKKSAARPVISRTKKSRASDLLQGFVRREPTQQDEISTSVVEDKEKTEDFEECDGSSTAVDDRCDRQNEEKAVDSVKDAKDVTQVASVSPTSSSNKCGNGSTQDDVASSEKPAEDGLQDEAGDVSAGHDSTGNKSAESTPEMPRKKIKLDKTTTCQLFCKKNTPVLNKSKKTFSKRNRSLSNTKMKPSNNKNLITAFVKKGISRPEQRSPKLIKYDNCNKSSEANKSNVDDISNTDSDKSAKIISDDASINESKSSEDNSDSLKDDNAVSKLNTSDTTKSSVVSATPASKKNVKPVKITPKTRAKELEKQKRDEEHAKKREEKIKLRKEKDDEKAKKEEERLKLKKEKEDELKSQREELKRKKQEELESKNKDREEKRQKIEDDKRVKDEEKQKKDDEKKAKEVGKKKLIQEDEERKKKVAQKFANFFVASKAEAAAVAAEETQTETGPFRQMQISRNTVLAPLCRCLLTHTARTALDALLLSTATATATYLALLSSGQHAPQRAPATPQPVTVKGDEDKDDCVIIEEEKDDDDDDDDELGFPNEAVVLCQGSVKIKGKLLKFCENRRPAYWGTWTKAPAVVGPRRPFLKEEIFDYDYDSDDDWEEEEENGESLSDSEGEKEEDDEQYEVDNEFFVPHGYLSDDEGQEDAEEEEGGGEVAKKEDAPASHDNKEKLKAKQAEFEKEIKKQTKQLKPRVFGCLWLHQDTEDRGAAHEHLLRVLSAYRAVVCTSTPDDGSSSTDATTASIACVPTTPNPTKPSATPLSTAADTPTDSALCSSKRKFCKKFPDEAVPYLVRLIHGNRHKKLFMVREFAQYWQRREEQGVIQPTEGQDTGGCDTPRTGQFYGLSNRLIDVKITELGEHQRCPDEGPYHNQNMWYVSTTVREQYGVTDAFLPNDWSYILQGKKAKKQEPAEHLTTPLDATADAASKLPAGGSALARTPASNLITKFTKVLTEDERAALNKKKGSLIKTPQSHIKSKVNTVEGAASGADALAKSLINKKSLVVKLTAITPVNKIGDKISQDVASNSKTLNKDSEVKGTTNKRRRASTGKKRVSLLSASKGQDVKSSPRTAGSIMAFLKTPSVKVFSKGKTGNSSACKGKRSSPGWYVMKVKPSTEEDTECITLD